MSLEKINSACSNYFVAQDENYDMSFARNYEGELQKVNLYRVVHTFTREEICVLSESFEGAISQASCKFGRDKEKFLVAKMIPFLIRGWGNNKF